MKKDSTAILIQILLVSLYFMLGLIQFDLPFSNSLFIIISAVLCFIYSPVLFISVFVNNFYNVKEKLFLIISFIGINSVLLTAIFWGITREIILIYFLIAAVLLIGSEVLYHLYKMKESSHKLVKNTYAQIIITIPLLLILLLMNLG